MKKEYIKPAMSVVELRQRTQILSGSPIPMRSSNNADIDEVIESDEGYTGGIR
jgi:hypothetical protein